MNTHKWTVEDVTETDIDKLGAWLALILRKGDLLLLEGDLGAGKTTLARAIIRHFSDNRIDEIPSPTFSLLQQYETPRAEIFHFDLYRLSGPDEVYETGLDEALHRGVTLIEWPDRLADMNLPDHLGISLNESKEPNERCVTLTGHGAWRTRIQRLEQMVKFAEEHGWGATSPRYMQGDASARAYARIGEPDRPAILMDAPAQPDGPPVRDNRPYSRIAHLAEDVRPFVAIASSLRDSGFQAPEIYASDLDAGFLVLEDMGTRVFGDEISVGRAMAELYGAAVDILIEMRGVSAPDTIPLNEGPPYILPAFDLDAFLIEAELLIDWYWPALKGEDISDEGRRSFRAMFASMHEKICDYDTGWILRDYHSPNLIWLHKAQGKLPSKHVGIIDFQDAMRGPRAYDLVSLLQDARLDVPEELEGQLLANYIQHAQRVDPAFDKEKFELSYAILGLQRNTKILGIFARLAIRDGKSGYLAHVPRIWRYIERNLRHAQLQELKNWYDQELPAKLRSRELFADMSG